MSEPKPQRLGKYQIIDEIGRGGFSVVYKALDTSLHNRPVALKVLHPHLLVDPTFVQRFQQEAGAAANLRHPNIVVVYEVGEIDGAHYIAMEYLSGTPLDELIKQEGPLAPLRAVKIISHIASALDYAHEKGFIHRDVKSGNIMVGEDDHATLTDFGLVRAAEGTMLTSTGRIMGTPEYMSPEQAEGEEIDYRSDLYSLGVVMFEMFTGQVPFKGDTPSATHYMHVHKKPPRATQLNPNLPLEAEAILLKALAKHPQGRYQNGKEFGDALETSVDGHKLGEGGQKPRRLRVAWIAGAALTLVVLAVSCAVFMWGKGLPTALPPTETPTATIQPTPTWTRTATASPTNTTAPTATLTGTAPATQTSTPSPTLVPVVPATPTPTPVPLTATATTPPAPPGMIYMPGGEVEMADGGTIHLEPYYIDAHPVTWGEYKRCVDAVACGVLGDHHCRGGGCEDYMPISAANWYDADRYCRWAGKRLPTLAEWQKACVDLPGWDPGVAGWSSDSSAALSEWLVDQTADGESRLITGDCFWSGNWGRCRPSTCYQADDWHPDDVACGFRCAADVE